MTYKIGDAAELAKIWRVPESWIRSQTRQRTRRDQQIPHIRFGRYVRFELDSPSLNAWLEKHRTGGGR